MAQRVELRPKRGGRLVAIGRLIAPIACEGVTNLPEMDTPSFENENAPLVTGSGGANVNVSDVSHEAAVTALF
jgi:hypothetical protein